MMVGDTIILLDCYGLALQNQVYKMNFSLDRYKSCIFAAGQKQCQVVYVSQTKQRDIVSYGAVVFQQNDEFRKSFERFQILIPKSVSPFFRFNSQDKNWNSSYSYELFVRCGTSFKSFCVVLQHNSDFFEIRFQLFKNIILETFFKSGLLRVLKVS